MFENLLRPGRINSLEVRNRIMVGPMERAMANPDGTLNERYIDYMRERAIGGAGLIQLESTFVDLGGRGNPYQVGCHDDIVIPALTRMAQTLHEHGAKLAMELHHGGRQASPFASGRQPIAPSAIGSSLMGPGAIPRAMTKSDIDYVIGAWAAAARRCLESGVDLIHLHGAHGYLLGQFLSPQSNVRTDEYGGSLANRARFALEVYAAVREVVGPDYPIGYRISAVEFVPGGLELDETVEFCTMLADAGIDLIDVAAGTYESLSKIFQGAEAPKGGFVPFAAAIKAAVGDRVPVGVAQRLADPEFADAVMSEHNLDYISLTRAIHADPHYARKLAEQRPEDILPCIGCNACLWMTMARVPARCAANPQSNHEEDRRTFLSPQPKRVLVVGGGVGGMQAARLLARRGNTVTLVEAGARLGGQLLISSTVQPDHALLASWLERQLARLEVDVRLGTPADLTFVTDFDADVVVVATGARGKTARFPITGGVRPRDLFEAFAADASQWGERVAIVGGEAASCWLALRLAARGKTVTIVETTGQAASNSPVPGNIAMNELLDEAGITVIVDATAEALDGGVLRIQQRGEPMTIEVDDVVVGNRQSELGLAEAIKASEGRAMVRTIGDCVMPRDVYHASDEAAAVAEEISRANTLVLQIAR